MKIVIVFLASFLTMACTSKQSIELDYGDGEKKSLAVQDFDTFENVLQREDETIYVVNFWATWCKPCVKELPYFEHLGATYKNQNVEVVLVSLDFPEQINDGLIPFVEKRKLQSELILLDDADANTWIPKVDENWSGAIPATVIYKGDKRLFFERSFTQEELTSELEAFLQ